VRYLELPQIIQPLAITPPLRILGMIASPNGLPPLNVERERQRIETALANLRAPPGRADVAATAERA